MPDDSYEQMDTIVNIELTQALAGLLAGLLGWVEQLVSISIPISISVKHQFQFQFQFHFQFQFQLW